MMMVTISFVSTLHASIINGILPRICGNMANTTERQSRVQILLRGVFKASRMWLKTQDHMSGLKDVD